MEPNERREDGGWISATEAETLAGLFQSRCQQSPEAVAYQQYDAQAQAWQRYSWAEMAARVACWQHALQREGFEAGERLALYLPNSIEWVCCEQAALAQGLATVPLYHLDSPENIALILQDAGASILLLAHGKQWQELSPWHAELSQLRLILCLDMAGLGEGPLLRSVASWLPERAEPLASLSRSGKELATIIYASGTTGRPKGVMLCHHNILSNAEMVQQVVPARSDDTFLSFLPLSHSFERTVGYYIPMMAGAQVAFCRSIQDLAEDLLTVRPTVLISVPRIYERVYGRIQAGLKEKGAVARLLFRAAVATGWRLFLARQAGKKGSLLDRLRWPLLQRLVAAKIMARLGGRLRLAVTGGAPLNDKVGRLFIGLGLPLLQGYGLTESAPVVSANTMADNVPASVGRALPGMEVRLGRDHELLVRSASTMIGYWQRPADFQAAVDKEGWLATGDVVEVDEGGHIHIRGRLKEILVTSTGENVAPANLEAAMAEDPLIYQAMVVGEGKPFLAALVVVERNAWQLVCQKLGLAADDPSSLESEEARAHVLSRLAPLLSSFPRYAQIRAVHLSSASWSLKDGLVTSLLKLRRQEIERHFHTEIAALYQGHDLPGLEEQR